MTKNSVLKRLRRFDQSWIYLVLVFFAIVYLFPILWVILSSFKDGSELFRWPPTLLPEDPTVQNYVQAFEKGDFGRFFLNSGLVTIAATILTIINVETLASRARNARSSLTFHIATPLQNTASKATHSCSCSSSPP